MRAITVNLNHVNFSLSGVLHSVSSSQMTRLSGGGYSVQWPWTNEAYVFDHKGLHKLV